MPEVGDLVAGRYRIEERLGQGATGVVFRAAQPSLGREVALKVLHPRIATDPGARARFEREARVASALSHESAVQVYDFGEDGQLVYLAMELLRGSTLRGRIDGEPLPLDDALTIAREIADVLTVAHRLPLVHRDLKPENVFLEGDEGESRVRVVDFGLAFIAGEARADRMTAYGVVTGTPEYLSPEQARGEQVGPATDVYALGCILYELLTGRVPFRGSDMEVLTKQMFAAPPPLAEHHGREPVPTALDRLIRAMLQKRPERRPDADAIVAELAEIDPTRRERARDDTYLMGRKARMVAASAVRGDGATGDGIEVAIAGDVDPELWLALAANGIVAWAAGGDPIDEPTLVFAPLASVDAVEALCRAGHTVLTDTAPGDMKRISALLAAGAAEVVVRPTGADDLSRRLRRVARRRAKHER
jgi:serine/threonine-protein kinase